MTTFKKFSGLLAVVILCGSSLIAQTKNDAITAYNKAVELMKTDQVGAIAPFEECIGICQKVGADADELRLKAEGVVPELYYAKATNLYKEKKVNESAAAYEEAIKVAQKYNSQKTVDKSNNALITVYNVLGTNYVKAGDNANALAYFNKILTINPKYIKAYLNKQVVYSKMDDPAKVSGVVDTIVNLATAENDTVSMAQAKKSARSYFIAKGSKAKAAKQYPQALESYNKALSYNIETTDIYYQLATIYNAQKKYDLALENVGKALQTATGTDDVMAKYYYEQGVAYAGKAETDNACAAFKKAQFGQFLQAAKAQQTNLKCK